MPRPNPLSGPAYVIALRNALEKRPSSEYQEAPRTGGTQVSIRLDEFIFNHVEAITAKSGWNRARSSARPNSTRSVRPLRVLCAGGSRYSGSRRDDEACASPSAGRSPNGKYGSRCRRNLAAEGTVT